MYFVYALIDPRTDSTGYIGITNNPNQRYAAHMEGNVGNGRKCEWIKSLQEAQVQPKMKILEIVDNLEQARMQEQHWIRSYISKGVSLTNIHHNSREVQVADPPPLEKSIAPPLNLYTASEAKEKLKGIAGESLKRLVENGQIRKAVPPGNKKRGLYAKEDVDKLAAAMDQFTKLYF